MSDPQADRTQADRNHLDRTRDQQTAGPDRSAAEDEVVQLCSELIRIDSVNTGDPDTIGDGEARAARYIQAKLDEVGYETVVPGGGSRSRQRDLPAGRRRSAARRTADPRARGRGAGARPGVDGRSVLRRRAGRVRLGPRRGGHEGHGGHDGRRGQGVQTHRVRAAAGPDLRVHVRRGGRWRVGGALAGRAPSRIVRRRHRGHLRGRRFLHPAGRPAACVPGRGGREGRRLGHSHGVGPRRARVDGERGQRRHPGRGGGGQAGRARVPADPHPDGRRAVRCRARAHRAGIPRGRPGRRGPQDRSDLPDRQRDAAQHREPHHAQGRVQGERHPVHRRGHRGLPGAARARRSTSGRRSRRSSATAWRSTGCGSRRWSSRSRATWWRP